MPGTGIFDDIAAQVAAPAPTVPRGTKPTGMFDALVPQDTYHRDRLKAYIDDPNTKRFGADATTLDILQRNAADEADRAAPPALSEQDYRLQAGVPLATGDGSSMAPDRRGVVGKTADLARATAMGARTGVYQGLSAIDTAGNLAGVVPDEMAQRMHDLAKESARASDLGGAQGALASGAELASGLPVSMNPITAPLVAGGQTGEQILDTTGGGLLAAGDRRKATMAAIMAGVPAAMAPVEGKAVGSMARAVGPTTGGMFDDLFHAATVGAGYTLPGPVATGLVAGDDDKLAAQAKAGIEAAPEQAGIMTGAGLLGPAAGALARGVREPAQLDAHGFRYGTGGEGDLPGFAAQHPEDVPAHLENPRELARLWDGFEDRPASGRIYNDNGQPLSDADAAAMRLKSPDELGTIKHPEDNDAPFPDDPIADFSPEEMRSLALRMAEGGRTLGPEQGLPANRAADYIRSVPKPLLEVPVNKRGDTLGEALKQIQPNLDPDGAMGNAQMLVESAKRNAPAYFQSEQFRNRQRVLSDEENARQTPGEGQPPVDSTKDQPPIGRSFEEEQAQNAVQQPGKGTDPNLRALREQESSSTQRDLSRVEESDEQARQQEQAQRAEGEKRAAAELAAQTGPHDVVALHAGPESLAGALRPTAKREFTKQLAAGTLTPAMRGHVAALENHLGHIETVMHRNSSQARLTDQAGNEVVSGNIGPNHHRARVGMSPAVEKFIKDNGRSALPGLKAAIRRAAEGKKVNGNSKGGKWLLENGLDAIADGRQPDEAPDGLQLLRDLGIAERSGQAPMEGKPVETGSFPPIGPIREKPGESRPAAAEVSPLERARAEEEEGARPVADQPPAEPVRQVPHESLGDQRERLESEETEKEGGSHAAEDHQPIPEAVRGEEGQAGVLRDREQAGAGQGDVQEKEQAQPGRRAEQSHGAPAGEVISMRNSDGKKVIVDFTRDVPLAGGVSTDGNRVYIDPELPRELTMDDGTVASVPKYMVEHETKEHPAMDDKSYPRAHDENAVPAENALLRKDGIDPDEYNAKLKPFIDKIAARSKAEAARNEPQNIPPDLHPKHVDASRKAGLLSETKMQPNTRPDLAIRAEDPQQREDIKLHDATRVVPERVTVSDNIRAAHEELDKDFWKAANRLEDHLNGGGAASGKDVEMSRQIRDRLKREFNRYPSIENDRAYKKWLELDRVAGTRWSEAGQALQDRVQTPAGRLAEAEGIARTTPVPLARKIQEKARDNAKDSAAQAAHKAAAAAHRSAIEDLAKSAAPKPKSAKQEALKAKQKELADEFDKLTKKALSMFKFSSNKPLGSNRFFEIGYDLMANRIKAGYTVFSRAAIAIARKVRDFRYNDEAKRALEESYDRHAEGNDELEPRSESADEAFLADRIAREKAILAAREKNLAAKWEATKGMSDEELRDYLNREDQQGKLHPEIQALRADFAKRTAAMTAAMKERQQRAQAPDIAARKAAGDAARQAKRIAGEPQRILDAERALVEKAAKLKGMTDDQVRQWYKDNAAKIPPEIQRLRADSKERTAAVRAEIAKRTREAFAGERAAKRLEKRVAQRQKDIDALKVADFNRYQRIKGRLKKYGFDLDDPEADWTKSKAGFDQFLLAQRAAGAGLGAMLNEHYIAILHASLKLPLVKTGSDLVALGLDVAQRPLRAAVGGLASGLQGNNYRAMMESYKAMWPGFKEGLSNAAKSFHTEHAQFPNEELSEMNMFPAVPGGYGRGIRLAGGLTQVRMIDSAAKTLFARMELADHAYRTAVDEKGKALTGDALTKHVQHEMTTMTSASWRAAIDHANRMTFTETPIFPVHQLNTFKYTPREDLVGKVGQAAALALTPFTVIPTNIATQALTRFVPGLSDFLTLCKGLHKVPETGEYGWKTPEGKDTAKRSEANLVRGFHYSGRRDIADTVTRWAMAGLIAKLTDDDTITGRDDPKFPHSIHLMGHHFDYERLGAIGKGLSVLVDSMRGLASGKTIDRTAASLKDLLGDEALVRPITDLVKANDAEKQGHNGWAEYLANHTPVPTVVGQINKATQNVVPDRYAGQKGMTEAQSYLHFLQDRIGLPWNPAPRFKDGAPMPKDSFKDWPIGTWLWRAMSPMAMEDERRPPKEHGRVSR